MSEVAGNLAKQARFHADRILNRLRIGAGRLASFLNPETPADDDRRPTTITPDKLLLLAIVVIVLGLTGFTHGYKTYEAKRESAEFYQHYFVPALNLACSGRFSRIMPNEEAEAFLRGDVDEFHGCEAIREAEPIEFWAPFDNQSTYLYWSTVLIWKIFGISWSSLALLSGCFTGLFAVSAFFFFRIFSASSLLAGAAALALLYFAVVTAFVPHLRDFSKAPFTLLPLALAGLAATRTLSAKAIFWIFVAAGLCVAVGRGFRPDVIVTVPIIIVAALLLFLGRPMKAKFRTVAQAIGGFLLAIFIGSLPLQISAASHQETGTLSAHFFNLGYAENFFEGSLEMDSPGYSTSRFYEDGLVAEAAYAYQADDVPRREIWNRPEYDDLGWKAFFDLTTVTPHDAFMRAFYALKKIIQHSPLAERLPGLMLICYFLLGALILPRRAIYLLVLSGGLISIVTLQFDTRHYFHLFALTPAAILLFLGAAQTLVSDMRHKRLIRLDYPSLAVLAVVIAGIAMITAVLDPMLSRIQDGRLNKIQQDYQALVWRPLDVERSDFAVHLTDAPEGDQLVMMKVERSAEADADLRSNRSVRLDPYQGSTLTMTEDFDTLSMTGIGGYQAVSEPIKVEEVEGKRQSHIILYADVVVSGDRIAFGAQSVDQSRWIGSPGVVSDGAFKGIFEFPVSPEDEEYRIVIEKMGTNPGDLIINRLYALPTSTACLPGVVTYHPLYRSAAGAEHRGWPEVFEPADVSTYYFPASFGPALQYDGLILEGTNSNCISSVSWSPLTEGGPRVEIMLADGRREAPARRGDLAKVLNEILFETIQNRK